MDVTMYRVVIYYIIVIAADEFFPFFTRTSYVDIFNCIKFWFIKTHVITSDSSHITVISISVECPNCNLF